MKLEQNASKADDRWIAGFCLWVFFIMAVWLVSIVSRRGRRKGGFDIWVRTLPRPSPKRPGPHGEMMTQEERATVSEWFRV